MTSEEKSQADKFKEAARDLDCDTDEKRFAARLAKVARSGSKNDIPKEEAKKP